MHTHHMSKHIYTDGSKTPEGVGFGTACGDNWDLIQRGTLPQGASVYTAEVIAIAIALRKIGTMNGDMSTIFTDSQSSLEVLNRVFPSRPLVQDV